MNEELQYPIEQTQTIVISMVQRIWHYEALNYEKEKNTLNDKFRKLIYKCSSCWILRRQSSKTKALMDVSQDCVQRWRLNVPILVPEQSVTATDTSLVTNRLTTMYMSAD